MTAQTLTPEKPAPQAPKMPASVGIQREKRNFNWWVFALICVCSLTILIPMYFVVVNALKTPGELAANAFSLPSNPQWSNFSEAWTITGFPRALMNSALITVASVVLTLLSNSLVAYAIARNMQRKRFMGMYYYLVTALFIPFPVIMLPVAKMTSAIGLDNQVGLILLYVVYGMAFNVFLYVGYIRSIPEELEEAAALEGASTWKIFWQIIFPLLTPMNATVGILTCLWAWNDFMLPLIMLADPAQQTLPLVQYVFSGQFVSSYNLGFASYLMAMLPMIVVYIFAQRWVISGVMRGSVK
ncbi:carbohydrate ABC transporter permease [Micrococcales bacterium 31B]|nr:carbohydrate ABC transporter permease [Micrococcales bacterium 31B]